MNTKKKIASPFMMTLCLIGVGMMTFALISSLCMGIESLQTEETSSSAGAYFVMTAVSLFFDLFFLLGLNTCGAVVWVKNDTLYRKGFLFGHKRSCPVSDIQRLDTVPHPRGGTWIYIVDSESGVCENSQRNSYIGLADSPANRKFIATFCERMIREQK